MSNRWGGNPWNKNPWNKQRQATWRERALDRSDKSPPYPNWQRIGMLALGAHRKDGTARFAPGELQQLVGIASKQQLSNELKKAKEYGWIASTSTPTCLVVPAHSVDGGM